MGREVGRGGQDPRTEDVTSKSVKPRKVAPAPDQQGAEKPAPLPTPRAEDLDFGDGEMVCPHPDCICSQCETMRAEALVNRQRHYAPRRAITPYVNRFPERS